VIKIGLLCTGIIKTQTFLAIGKLATYEKTTINIIRKQIGLFAIVLEILKVLF
jgi:hypothetical protein